MSATPALEVPADETATVVAPASEIAPQGADGSETAQSLAPTQESTSQPPPAAPEPPAVSASHGAAERVRQSKLLPPALKERLALLVEASSGTSQNAQRAAPIEEALRAVEEALPDFLLGGRSRANKPEHPGGDSFFSGDPRELSDAEAEQIAREQLLRSGLLRGQRVRVAD